jgi:hypothetical protein
MLQFFLLKLDSQMTDVVVTLSKNFFKLKCNSL